MFTTQRFGLQEIGLASIWGHVSPSVFGFDPIITYDPESWGLKIRDFKSARFQNHLTLINGRYRFTPINGRFVWLATDNWEVWIPHWILIVLFATFAALPWISYFKCRFSVRTLLITTTLVAVVLGAIVYVSRQ